VIQQQVFPRAVLEHSCRECQDKEVMRVQGGHVSEPIDTPYKKNTCRTFQQTICSSQSIVTITRDISKC